MKYDIQSPLYQNRTIQPFTPWYLGGLSDYHSSSQCIVSPWDLQGGMELCHPDAWEPWENFESLVRQTFAPVATLVDQVAIDLPTLAARRVHSFLVAQEASLKLEMQD